MLEGPETGLWLVTIRIEANLALVSLCCEGPQLADRWMNRLQTVGVRCLDETALAKPALYADS
jgi:hypothetical protein